MQTYPTHLGRVLVLRSRRNTQLRWVGDKYASPCVFSVDVLVRIFTCVPLVSKSASKYLPMTRTGGHIILRLSPIKYFLNNTCLIYTTRLQLRPLNFIPNTIIITQLKDNTLLSKQISSTHNQMSTNQIPVYCD